MAGAGVAGVTGVAEVGKVRQYAVLGVASLTLG